MTSSPRPTTFRSSTLPPEFGGPERTWSPEHLFVAAVSSCLMTTFRAIAEMSELES